MRRLRYASSAGYHGPLYAEISPKTFPVLLREGSRLSQVRFRTGDAVLDADELEALHASERLVDCDDADLVAGVALSVDLSGATAGGFVGYRAKRHTGVIDIDRRGGYAVDEFWEPIDARPDGSLILDPGEFYILASKESVQVPPDYAAEMVPFDPLVGEFRVHYAGFFDPDLAMPGRVDKARARSWRCARARCHSFWSTARSSGGWCTKGCCRGQMPSMASASAQIIRRRA